MGADTSRVQNVRNPAKAEALSSGTPLVCSFLPRTEQGHLCIPSRVRVCADPQTKREKCVFVEQIMYTTVTADSSWSQVDRRESRRTILTSSKVSLDLTTTSCETIKARPLLYIFFAQSSAHLLLKTHGVRRLAAVFAGF